MVMSNWRFARTGTNKPMPTGLGEDNAHVLDAIPVVNSAVRVELQDNGALLWLPLRPRWWMGPPISWVLPFRREKGIALDGLGRQVLESCDGNSSVERIVEDFARRHKLRFHEARQSVLLFLKMLLERKVVALVVKPSTGEHHNESCVPVKVDNA
jgi:hypothetical protein